MVKERIKKHLTIGLIGAIITVVGEMSQGLAETVPSADMMIQMFDTYAMLPIWRIGFGSTVGAIGILLQYFGVHAIYLSFNSHDDTASKRYKLGIYNYVFVGAIIHILMSLMIYVYKINTALLMEFTIWFVVPFLLLFLVGYIWFSIIMFNKFRKNDTLFPSWCCVLNPVIGKVVFNAVSALIPFQDLSNGVSYSNMGITAIIIFSVLLCVIKDDKD